MTSGAKFGGDFLAYPGDPLLYHAQFTVRCVRNDAAQHPLALAAAARMAHAARYDRDGWVAAGRGPFRCSRLLATATASTWCWRPCTQRRMRCPQLRRASTTSRFRQTFSRARTATTRRAPSRERTPPRRARRDTACLRCAC